MINGVPYELPCRIMKKNMLEVAMGALSLHHGSFEKLISLSCKKINLNVHVHGCGNICSQSFECLFNFMVGIGCQIIDCRTILRGCF